MQKYLIAFIFMFYTATSYAGIGFTPPALSFTYYYMFLLPWLFVVVLILETIVLYYLQKNITVKRAIRVIFISNIVSIILGIFITGLLSPSFSRDDHGYLYMGTALLGVPIAYILSIIIEYIVLRLIKNIDKPFICSFLMNTTSYGFIVAFMYYLYFN
jgi:hypothetical protein